MIDRLGFGFLDEAFEEAGEPSPQGDARLIRHALERDPAALQLLADRLVCVPRILAGLARQRGFRFEPSELEDLAQDTLVKVWEKLGDFPDYATLEMWVFRFCQYEFLNRIRRLDRRTRGVRAIQDVPDPSVEAKEGLDPEWTMRLAEELDRLGEHEAEVIRLKHFERRTFDQLADRYRLSPNTIKAQYYRGLAKLRAALERTLSPEDLS